MPFILTKLNHRNRKKSITSTKEFQIINDARPAGEKSQFISNDVTNADTTLHAPLSRNNVLSVMAYFSFPKINAIKIKDKPIPPHPYISRAQANEPGLAIVNTGSTIEVSGGKLFARYGM